MRTNKCTAPVAVVDHPEKRPELPAVELFGLKIINASKKEVLAWLMGEVEARRKTTVNFVNAHCVNVANRDLQYFRVLQGSQKLLPDGSGIRMAFAMRGIALKANLNGTDLFPSVCEKACKKGYSLFLLGAAPGVAEQTARNIQLRYPKLTIAGIRDGYFSDTEEPALISQINESGAQILFVAMGVPKQEKWLLENEGKLNTVLNLGVGGLFDFYSLRISRAPRQVRQMGLEWIWRLSQEPGRMWRRYILGNPQFVFRAWFDRRRHVLSSRINLGSHGRRLYCYIRRVIARSTVTSNAVIKRCLDIAISTTALVVLSPLLLILTIAVKIDSPGSVIFTQIRIGKQGVPFRFLKIRSMYVDAEVRREALMRESKAREKILFKMKHDPRITPMGKFIRRYSLDELPQLWNVIRGDMTLVGPRPALAEEVEKYSLKDRYRLSVDPGVTGIWQISGRSDTPFSQQVQMDLDYIRDKGILQDVILLAKTIPAVISGRGAY